MWLRRSGGIPMRAFALCLAFMSSLAVLAGCTGGGAAGSSAALPSGDEVLKKSSAAMRTVKSAAFAIETEGRPPVPVRKADGRLTATGDGDGTVQVEVLGSLQELAFVLLGDTVHFKGPTGGYQKMTRQQLAAFYDPSAILDPAKGVPALLASSTKASTQAEETVGDVAAYRVAASLSKQALSAFVPGIDQGSDATLWVDKASGRLVKASLPLGQGENAGKVIVTLRDYDVPVQVTPPK
ncbi:LppX_LprAFG lipoprotein [Spongiactinospora sp. TRM90649]|uniref:LppX_LprAFG lipoprotein n=1 Tax=Spongiactinospora sp. TRM90649 TaxID=3031114 RepID=UPI0023F71B81|nr:LppX_LprAFG lipoprotein [Spongiactinospora sp. TRM90649]MDF5755913.1 LppX_LprAFG lipoprotein [Spongiactinospora sp. TRM90649]